MVGAKVETAVATEVDVVAMELDVVDMVVEAAAAAMVALVVALAEAKAVATVAANMVAPPLIFFAIDHIVAKNDPEPMTAKMAVPDPQRTPGWPPPFPFPSLVSYSCVSCNIHFLKCLNLFGEKTMLAKSVIASSLA